MHEGSVFPRFHYCWGLACTESVNQLLKHTMSTTWCLNINTMVDVAPVAVNKLFSLLNFFVLALIALPFTPNLYRKPRITYCLLKQKRKNRSLSFEPTYQGSISLPSVMARWQQVGLPESWKRANLLSISLMNGPRKPPNSSSASPSPKNKGNPTLHLTKVPGAEWALGSFHTKSTKKNPYPLRFLWKLAHMLGP